MRTITYDLDLDENRTIHLKFPEDIPLGRHQVIVIVDENPANPDEDNFEEILKDTAGIWKHHDGLTYQIKLRSEWDRL